MGDYANVNNTDGAQGTYGVEEEYIESVFFLGGKPEKQKPLGRPRRR